MERNAQRRDWVWRAGKLAFGADDWTRAWGQSPNRVWTTTIDQLSDDELKRALHAFTDGTWTYPPNPGKFARAGRDQRLPEQRVRDKLIAENEQRAALPAPEDAAQRTAEGRRWLAYWWLREMRPRPAEVTMDQIDEMLAGADLEAMDREVALGVDCIRQHGHITGAFVSSQRRRLADARERTGLDSAFTVPGSGG